MKMPQYIETSIQTIIALLDAGLFTPSSAVQHREIQPSHKNPTKNGRAEIVRPGLDWKWVARIRGREGEMVWDWNHNQLPAELHQKHLQITEDYLCPICKTEPETDNHLTLDCLARHENKTGFRIQHVRNLSETQFMETLATAQKGDGSAHSSEPTTPLPGHRQPDFKYQP